MAVAAFLAGKLRFDLIPVLIEHVLGAVITAPLRVLDDVFDADRAARECARSWLERNHHVAKTHVLAG
jgi:1-deoxy-D-xylulose 5-phosphate reductoisomerase